jgi:hypothetical protein
VDWIRVAGSFERGNKPWGSMKGGALSPIWMPPGFSRTTVLHGVYLSLRPSYNTSVGFEFFTALKVQVVVFWVVTSRSDVVGCQRFGGPCCLLLNMDPTTSFARVHISEDRDLRPNDVVLKEYFRGLCLWHLRYWNWCQKVTVRALVDDQCFTQYLLAVDTAFACCSSLGFTVARRAVFLNRRAAARYRALGLIIPGRERFSWNLSF